jgi:hypothetical protein
MKTKVKQYVAMMMAALLAFSNVTFANAYREFENPVGEISAQELRFEELAPSLNEQTVSVGAVQASLFATATGRNYVDVSLTLDEDPGIFAFAYHLDFDDSAWEAVSVTLAPNSSQRGIFMPTLPPLDGGSNSGRLTFLGFIDDWNDPDTTGTIATIRFRGIGRNPDVSSFILDDLEVVGSNMEVSSLVKSGDDFPSLLDAARLHRYIAGLPGHGMAPFCTSLDINNDRRIDMRDLLLMSQMLVGHSDNLRINSDSLNLFPDNDSDGGIRNSGSSQNSTSSSGTNFTTKPMISGGYNHVLALKSDGTVWACAYVLLSV